jgi:hypothetical protein
MAKTLRFAVITSLLLLGCMEPSPKYAMRTIAKEDLPGTYFRANRAPEGTEVLTLYADGRGDHTFYPTAKTETPRKVSGKWILPDQSDQSLMRGKLELYDFDFKQLRETAERTSDQAQLRHHGPGILLCLGPEKFDASIKCYVKHYGML